MQGNQPLVSCTYGASPLGFKPIQYSRISWQVMVWIVIFFRFQVLLGLTEEEKEFKCNRIGFNGISADIFLSRKILPVNEVR